ncbi:PQQ-binding-like beta-propeller repeat protein [Rhizorhabdus sp.]|uniref:outer membrane protein assembly factor BamB family protein n=1 Tax=Rhizorhabdus sp. TaxID=1968843 RepID=UPI0019B0C234|nr:PQQ-binding-like beta-propeller repeat protein [Rhizorhabdus sp.]MBD3759645.1 PQQ-binding-like beta-propeller repeat protein [Rhizorhabdus sp.]
MILALASWQAAGQSSGHQAASASTNPEPPRRGGLEAFTKAPPFTQAQAQKGRALYDAHCAVCHATNLGGGAAERPLKGRAFMASWAQGRSVGELFKYIKGNMPPEKPGGLSDEDYGAIVALLVQENGSNPGVDPLPSDYQALVALRMPYAGTTSGGLALGHRLPPWPRSANPAEGLTPVTDAMLRDPQPGDWLTWRRTPDGLGFSPLAQINRENVGKLRLAWTYKFGSGANIGTPLIHDGVMFVQAGSDSVHALDAATGESLWRHVGNDDARGGKRNIALYQDKVIVGTSANSLLALDAKTGEPVWETKLGSGGSGGPLVANGVVIQGLGRGAIRGEGTCGNGGRIAGFDAVDGKMLWSFNTIPQPGEPGVDSWHDLPCANRNGAGVWTTGFFDADLDLVFFGTGNNYDNAPFGAVGPQFPSTGTGLYNNSTLALNPRTGKLAWHYQHMGGEVWDMDWMFERQVMMLPINGKMVKSVVTMGKPGILDALDAATGQYLFSIDTGLQTMVKSIDPISGAKTYDPAMVPGGVSKFICPLIHGVKNWLPAAYNPNSGMLYQPQIESCMTMDPAQPGSFGPFSIKVDFHIAPRPNSDGRIGRLQSFDLRKRRLEWNVRERAPWSSGFLNTAGGLLFTGSLDRQFSARDDRNGKILWHSRLADVPTGAPVTFSIGGKQYVAILTGFGAAITTGYLELVPEIGTPAKADTAVYVFSIDPK